MPENIEHPITTGDESHERDLDRHRGDDQRRALAEAGARLSDRGITVGDDESPEAVVDMLEAVERFEHAVEARGGDLMVDTAPAREPDDRRFVLPRRERAESAKDFADRVRAAARRIATAD